MVDKSVITPLYAQIAGELRREILAGKYGERGCIGTHAQIGERFGVSLITVRKAVQTLEKEGMVEILQGKGTFVRRASLTDPLQDLTGISNMMSSMQMDNQIAIPVFELRDTPEWLEDDVKRGLGEKSLFIRRVVSLGDMPVANADMYLPERYYGQILPEEVHQRTVYQIYRDKLGVTLGKGRQIIRAAGAREEIARSLQIPLGSPVLEIRRKAYDGDGQLIEFMILTYEASKYCYEVELELKNQ